jgi:hypothetical protein
MDPNDSVFRRVLDARLHRLALHGALRGAVRHVASIEQQLDYTWSARFVPNKRSVHSIHSLEVRLRFNVEELKPGRPPRPLKENPEPTTICKRVANPLSTRAVFNDHDDSTAIIEISDRNAAPLPGATTAGLNDEGIVAVVWRPRNASKKREVGDRVGDAYNGPGKSHRLTLRSRRATI